MKEYNLSYLRGDYQVLTVQVDGDVTDRTLTFVVKADKTVTTARLVEKDSELTTWYDEGITVITIPMLKTYMADLTAKTYYYDILSVDPLDASDSVTIVGGRFVLVADVQTPFDGTGSLPSDATRVVNVGLAEIGTATKLYLKWDNVNGDYKPITLAELATELSSELDFLEFKE